MIKKLKKIFSKFGPGIITGASDDDPSGIATYSMAGASQGYSLLWTSLFTFPLMAAIQEMCARIGLITGKGLAGNIRTRFKSKTLLYFLAFLIIVANTINIGADLAGMAAATRLLIPVYPQLVALLMTILIIALMVYFPYKFIASNLKWLTFTLFAYIASVVVTKQDWFAIIQHTFLPDIRFNKDLITILVAILGTTISPYLFFWQTSEEVEEMKEEAKEKHKKIIVTKHELKQMRDDVNLGMLFSNIVMYAIIATTASTLFASGIHEITTADQAAKALEPIAGRASYLLFTLGIIGTGLLAIPVLAGAAAYAVSEIFGWNEGLNKSFRQAKSFYAIIILSTITGLLMNFANVNPFKALFYTAVIYGLISPILIMFILLLANDKKLMGNLKNGLVSNILGVLTLVVMTLAAAGFIISL
ncbi:iron transporter [Candidatus Curtissbacteria bacterium RIFCSPHIGHO2_01_FULL_41_44]|uniref:Iron transporter n=1 Tax=Candidatus Curtissbacteria bacterium RIFCSPLOWO2_01_FULL_42_50 TaxID=1797730 RepID=A0A1F5H4C4_9BACT|nr:MAG: iron transporter [Candidatus Curtissbacteria bacterium RIFCSPHIGHO2_01_FULL_41_44]OGD93234.1 MAG: iron transporter [Candidatus Curtissbacteria bacterium RIFCSPHIGHO2_02_FULL_42_58]OGD96874.1 MAG: iron transporter [Candidatus Curtissbacteria bacterium RIFCSPHIGHO2_12_FULL_42_33]OGD98938.1 MAG: iron transporter [Candidatus Curtissbacteria bacterium RIFCSPLOWO2_01_FULL_42_50]OGE03482.1 MAG: iron transporter [Candidatus Curtissbacteria bacterium RIFCSPLOWO2_12_FULL_41_16]OGE11388.1 MAG: ir